MPCKHEAVFITHIDDHPGITRCRFCGRYATMGEIFEAGWSLQLALDRKRGPSLRSPVTIVPFVTQVTP